MIGATTKRSAGTRTFTYGHRDRQEDSSAAGRWLEAACLIIVVMIIIGIYGAFIRPGMPWADDWATYIQDALNLLHGTRYSTTGYIVNPDLDIGPTAYPPLYPLSLVVPIALWGIDFDAIREFQLIFWATFLVSAYLLARIRLNFVGSLLVVIAVGLSPYFLEFKDYIASEVLFLALLYITFVTSAWIENVSADRNAPTRNGILLGALIALCIATRSVGLILLPTLVVYDVLRFRRVRRESVIAVLIAGASFLGQLVLVDSFNDYIISIGSNNRRDLHGLGLQQAPTGSLMVTLTEAAAVISHHLSAFVVEFSRFWGQGAYGSLLPRVTSVVFGLLAILGFSRTVMRNVMLCDVFAALYIMTLLALPPVMAAARMEMPLVPLFYMYVLLAVRDFTYGSSRWIGIAAVVLLAGISYQQSYKNLDLHSPLQGLHQTDYTEMFEYIRTSTEPDSAIIFDKPRSLSLYTHRRSAAIYGTRKGDELLSYMRGIGARYILFYDLWQNDASREQYVAEFLGNQTSSFEVVHDSGHFVLYRLKA